MSMPVRKMGGKNERERKTDCVRCDARGGLGEWWGCVRDHLRSACAELWAAFACLARAASVARPPPRETRTVV